MAASPWTFISLTICLAVSVSVSSGSVVWQDGMHHNRVARQIPAEVQEKAEAAKQNFHDAASAGAQRAQDLAASAQAHLSQRVRRAADYYQHGQTGQGMGPRYNPRRGSSFSDGRSRRDDIPLNRREELSRERDERWRERQEREREREEREREREQDERERERGERRRERAFREREN